MMAYAGLMDHTDLVQVAHRRLSSSLLSSDQVLSPKQVVRWFGAMQAQEYEPAKWAIATRAAGVDNADLDEAVDDGRILRTHALRPTWHFVLPEDIGWLQALTGPRVHTKNGHQYRLHGLDDSLRKRTENLITNWISNDGDLSRKDIGQRLAAEGIEAKGNRLAYVLMSAELNGVVCSGQRRGATHTYALVSQRTSSPNELTGEAALAELTLRYFRSHGPATVEDMRWWSSLTLTQIRRGLELVGNRLHRELIGDTELWSLEEQADAKREIPLVQLLQPYDEYTVAYGDTKVVINAAGSPGEPPVIGGQAFYGALIIESQLAGWWRRTLSRREVKVQVRPMRPLSMSIHSAVRDVATAYGQFHGVPVNLDIQAPSQPS